MNHYQVEIKIKRPNDGYTQWISAICKDFYNYKQAVEFYHKYDNKEFVEKRYLRAKKDN